MPASDPLPSIRDLLTAASDAVVGTRQSVADTRRGSVYDHLAGSGAILVTREAARDQDLFRAVYLDTAEGDDLTRLVKLRYGIDRIVPSYGTGTALLTRPTVAAGGGTVWEGTRILVFASAASPTARSYATASDVVVPAGATAVTIPIRAADIGPGSAVNLSGPAVARVDDPLWDSSWQVAAVACSDGTALESAPDVRARARATQLAARSGYPDAIIAACVAQGAAYVALFDSNYTATDDGLCHCYVADAGFATTPRLIRACTVALEGVRVCGADLQLLGMQVATIPVSAVVTLRDDPGRLPSPDVALRDALAAAFVTTRYDYDLDELAGVLSGASADVQDVSFLSPTSPATILVSGQMPPVLTRYELGAVTLQYAGPS
ncbi:MAG: baseplate J/gp47 family protein [Polyangiaceae bacterium]